MYNRNNQRFSRGQRTLPTKFPAPLSLRHPEGDVDFLAADMAAHQGFFANLKNPQNGAFKFDRGTLVAAVREAKDRVLTAEALSKCLVTSAEWREPFVPTPEGGIRTCGFCETEFQPMLGPTFQRGDVTMHGGAVLVMKRVILEKTLAEKLGESRKELAADVVKSALSFTAEVMGGEAETPDMALAILACDSCREMVRGSVAGERSSTVCIADAKSALQLADERIGTADKRFALQDAFGGQREDNRHPRRNSGGGVHAEGTHNGGPRFNNNRRPNGGAREDNRTDWKGTSLLVFPDQAAALDAAGYTTLEQVLEAANSGDLQKATNGVINASGAAYLVRAISAIQHKAIPQSRETAGQADALVAPGVEAPVPSSKQKKSTGRRTLTAAAPQGRRGQNSRRSGGSMQDALSD